MQSSTAIVLFARRAEDEAVYKPLLSSNKKNVQLHDRLISTAKAAAKGQGTLIHFHEDLQKGDTFGERITNCVTSVFKEGFSRVVLIGGDCPDLSGSSIREAVCALDQHQYVLGADQHGGAYLIGFTRGQFEADTFQTLAWNTSGLFEELKSYALQFGGLTCLDEQLDLNSGEDVVFTRLISSRLQEILTFIFKKSTHFVSKSYLTLLSKQSLLDYRRGPPMMA